MFSLEQTKSAILPELVELTNDEECYVRLAGLETVVNILSLLDNGKNGQIVSNSSTQLFSEFNIYNLYLSFLLFFSNIIFKLDIE